MSGTTGEPRPENLPAPVATIPTPAPAPAAPPVNLPDDPDDRALAEARAAVAAQDQGQPGQQTPSAPAQQPGTQQARKDLRVPKARLDEALQRVARAEEEAAYLRGALDARTPQAGQQPGPQAPTPEPNLFQQIEAAIMTEQGRVEAAAKQFDEGELTMVQFKAIEFQAGQSIASLRERAVLAQVAGSMPKAAATSLSDQAILNRHQAEMEARHPWSTQLSNAELHHLAAVAKDEFAALGRPIGSGPQETIRLRQRVAELATKFGPDWYPDRQVSAPAAPANPAPARQQAAPAPRGQAGRQKLDLAFNHPPNLNQAGTGASSDTISAAQVAGMSTEEIAALPAATRQRILTG